MKKILKYIFIYPIALISYWFGKIDDFFENLFEDGKK